MLFELVYYISDVFLHLFKDFYFLSQNIYRLVLVANMENKVAVVFITFRLDNNTTLIASNIKTPIINVFKYFFRYRLKASCYIQNIFHISILLVQHDFQIRSKPYRLDRLNNTSQ